MADIRCAVCGEPWDAYGVFHGDMHAWEAELFRKGAGCPTCEGTPQGDPSENRYNQAVDVAIRGAWDDPHAFESVNDPTAEERPQWVRPSDPVVWACQGCKMKVFRDLDTKGPAIVQPDSYFGGRAYVEGIYWSQTPSGYRESEFDAILFDMVRDDTFSPADRLINGRPFCPDCAEECHDCGELTVGDEIHFAPDDSYCRKPTCTSCVEKKQICTRCSDWLDDDAETNEDGECEYCARSREEKDDEDAE